MKYPHLVFEVSTAEKDLPQKDKLEKYLQDFVPKFAPIENKIMSLLEKASGGRWLENKRTDIKATFIAVGITKSHPLELNYLFTDMWAEKHDINGTVKDFETMVAEVIHELCHIFSLSPKGLSLIHKKYYQKINDDNLNSYVSKHNQMQRLKDSALIHIYNQNLWRRVMDNIFSKSIVDKQEERAREVSPVYTESYRILDSLSDLEKQNLLRGV